MLSPCLHYHLPTIPFSPIDALNRRSAAVGSPTRAMYSTHSSHNGHHLNLWWNDYRKYYITEYFWAGRAVLARGDFASCLREAFVYYDRGALGSSVSISPREDDVDAIRLCDEHPRIVQGREPPKLTWWTWRHDAAIEAAQDAARPGCPALIFDWSLMKQAATREVYDALVKEKHGRVYA